MNGGTRCIGTISCVGPRAASFLEESQTTDIMCGQ